MYDMTFELHAGGGKCLYEQIYEHIKTEIKDGKLLAGERLPSTRSLADYLQVARSTVEYAYEQLLSEGYIESQPYRGYFVCAMEELFNIEEMSCGEEAKRSSAEGREGGSTSRERESWEYNFSPHDIDMSGFPFGVWKKITKNILTYGNSELFARGEAQGDYDLRETISRYLHSSRGVNCDPEQIIVGAGNDYLLMLLEKILGRHRRIAMENPTYMRTYRIFQSFAYDVVTVEMDENGMRTDCLIKENVNAAYVMPSHQYPMGIVMPIGRRIELLKWAAGGENRFLIEDDYDSEFRYYGKPIPALQASDQQGKVIYIGTFSKAIAPAIRISFMVLPRTLLERYLENCSFYSCTVSRIDQRILNEFIRDGYFERHLNKMRKIYRAKQERLLQCLEPFKERFIVSGETTGLHLILTAKGKIAEEELLEQAKEAGVKVYGLSDSMVQMSPRNAAVLLGFGGLSPEQITEGVKRLQTVWL